MQITAEAGALQSVMDAMPDMLRVVDDENQVVLANRSYAERFGNQCGNACYDMFCSEGACRNCVSKRAMQTGIPQDKRQKYQGRTYWVKASPLLDSLGATVGAVEVFRDVTELVRREETLRQQNKRLLQESNIAARMQRELFAPIGDIDPRISIMSRYLPASALGGDFFGCFSRADGRLCVYVADVSGHGIPAAMVSLVLSRALRSAQVEDEGPAALLARAREAFLEMTGDPLQYATMFVAELEPWSGRLRWANAGHNAVPILINGGEIRQLYAPALPICDWAEDIIYQEWETAIMPGGRLLLYTDGLLDKRSGSLTEEHVAQLAQNKNGEGLLAALMGKMYEKRADDVCVLLIERTN